MSEAVCDITVIGAGPVGLAAAYYAGHRDATVRIVESLGQLGGQVAAVYPEKHVYDVAGHPKIKGQDLVELCVEQGLQFGADVHLDEEVADLERLSQNGEELLALTTKSGKQFLSRALIVTAGHGAFEPRKLELEGIDDWEGRGLHYFVTRKDVFKGKNCVIVGGGDSALDWTLGLQDTADLPITLIHRRERFRALETSVNEARRLEGEGSVRICAPAEVREIHGDGSIQAVTVEDTGDRRDHPSRLRSAHPPPRLPLPPRVDRRLGPRSAREAPDPGRPDDAWTRRSRASTRPETWRATRARSR